MFSSSDQTRALGPGVASELRRIQTIFLSSKTSHEFACVRINSLHASIPTAPPPLLPSHREEHPRRRISTLVTKAEDFGERCRKTKRVGWRAGKNVASVVVKPNRSPFQPYCMCHACISTPVTAVAHPVSASKDGAFETVSSMQVSRAAAICQCHRWGRLQSKGRGSKKKEAAVIRHVSIHGLVFLDAVLYQICRKVLCSMPVLLRVAASAACSVVSGK